MANRALLIGSPVGGLQGTLHDVDTVAGLLKPRAFDVQVYKEAEATRAGILDAYQKLITDARDGDAVVIYYSGHGARTRDDSYEPADDRAPAQRYHQFIVPYDLDKSSEGDFRGIMQEELSSLLEALTRKTPNVAVILDCCHSAGMTRDLRGRVKSLSREWFVGAATHYESLLSNGLPGVPLDELALAGNKDAVRLVATTPGQSAWEFTDDEGQAYGLMTRALAQAFAEIGDRPVSWASVAGRVRYLVGLKEPGQYPDVEGPANRILFDLDTADLTGILPVSTAAGKVKILGGRLHGIQQGDRYTLMPAGFENIKQGSEVAFATVKWVGGSSSTLEVELAHKYDAVPESARAFPTHRAHEGRPVWVDVGGAPGDKLKELVRDSGFVRLPHKEETKESPEILALVIEQDGKVHIREKNGLDYIHPVAMTGDFAEQTVDNLVRLARARTLETLETGAGRSFFTGRYELDWGRVVAGDLEQLPKTGSVLYVGDRIYVRVRNKGTSNIYFSVLDIGLSGTITLINKFLAPSGIELAPDDEDALGHSDAGWTGLEPLTWNENVPTDGPPRPESLVVIVTDRPQDLRSLDSDGMQAAKGPDDARSELERLAAQHATGRTRDMGAVVAAPEVKFAVEHIQAVVEPKEVQVEIDSGRAKGVSRGPATAGAVAIERMPVAAFSDPARFLIDERPNPSVLYRRPKGLLKIPEQVAVQLGEIIVHKNRDLFKTDVRVDAMVVTGSKEPESVYSAGTQRFSGIKDGDRLPLDKLLVYYGPAKGFLDLAVWVSRDDDHSLALADLLKQQLNSDEFTKAAGVLAGLMVAAPQVGAIAAGLGAASVIASIAGGLLSAAVRKSIGLYRTSLLANDAFGVGRHPPTGPMRAQDFSFWYEVTDVD